MKSLHWWLELASSGSRLLGKWLMLHTLCKIVTMQAVLAGHQTLKLLQNIHSSGWLHRDVKPANFVRTRDSDPASGGEWRIVDFGLAKPYISRDGDIIDPRDGYTEFRGSTNYASVKAHQKEELGGVSFRGSCPLIVCAGCLKPANWLHCTSTATPWCQLQNAPH